MKNSKRSVSKMRVSKRRRGSKRRSASKRRVSKRRVSRRRVSRRRVSRRRVSKRRVYKKRSNKLKKNYKGGAAAAATGKECANGEGHGPLFVNENDIIYNLQKETDGSYTGVKKDQMKWCDENTVKFLTENRKTHEWKQTILNRLVACFEQGEQGALKCGRGNWGDGSSPPSGVDGVKFASKWRVGGDFNLLPTLILLKKYVDYLFKAGATQKILNQLDNFRVWDPKDGKGSDHPVAQTASLCEEMIDSLGNWFIAEDAAGAAAEEAATEARLANDGSDYKNILEITTAVKNEIKGLGQRIRDLRLVLLK